MKSKLELASNPENRYAVSPAVKRYIQDVRSTYPSMWEQMKVLRSKLANDLSSLC